MKGGFSERIKDKILSEKAEAREGFFGKNTAGKGGYFGF
jgi:hypothetical protein